MAVRGGGNPHFFLLICRFIAISTCNFFCGPLAGAAWKVAVPVRGFAQGSMAEHYRSNQLQPALPQTSTTVTAIGWFQSGRRASAVR